MLVQCSLHYCYNMSHNKNTKGKGKQISLFTMPGFRKNLSSSNEDVSLEEPIKDQTCVCTNLETILPRQRCFANASFFHCSNRIECNFVKQQCNFFELDFGLPKKRTKQNGTFNWTHLMSTVHIRVQRNKPDNAQTKNEEQKREIHRGRIF